MSLGLINESITNTSMELIEMDQESPRLSKNFSARSLLTWLKTTLATRFNALK